MKRRTYDDKLLTDYLLGSLPEEETGRLDELSFTDDEMAARLQTVENDLIDAYARGELTGQTLERFNSYYLSSPLRREKVAFARRFQDFLGEAITAGQTERGFTQAQKRASSKGFLPRHSFISHPALQWGLAAAALIAIIVGGWLAFENSRLENRMNRAQAEREEIQRREQQLQAELAEQRSTDLEKQRELASLRERLARLEQQDTNSQTDTKPNVVAFTLAPQMRGASQTAVIRVPADADQVSLKLELEPTDFTFYRADLKAQPGSGVVWKSGRLRAKVSGDGKSITVNLSAALLKSQPYKLEVYGVSPTGAAEIISSYPFRVSKQ